MADLKLTAGPETPGIDVGDWVLRGGAALAFFLFGSEKFSADPASPWIKLFDVVGLGQWFRYFTGALQLAGALLILIPRTARIGAAILACTMVGAVAVHIFIRQDPFAGLIPLVLLVLVVAAGLKRRGHGEHRDQHGGHGEHGD